MGLRILFHPNNSVNNLQRYMSNGFQEKKKELKNSINSNSRTSNSKRAFVGTISQTEFHCLTTLLHYTVALDRTQFNVCAIIERNTSQIEHNRENEIRIRVTCSSSYSSSSSPPGRRKLFEIAVFQCQQLSEIQQLPNVICVRKIASISFVGGELEMEGGRRCQEGGVGFHSPFGTGT